MGLNSKFKWSIALVILSLCLTIVTFQNCAKVKFSTLSSDSVKKDDCPNNECIQVPDICEENPSLPECQVKVCEPRTITSDGCNQPPNGISQKKCNDQGTEWGSCVISCNSGYVQDGETCKANACKGTIPSFGEKCINDDVTVPANISWALSSSCTDAKKCEFRCNSSHNFVNGSCVCKNNAVDAGTCKQCAASSEFFGGNCVSKCASGQTRNSEGVCVAVINTREVNVPAETLSEDPLVKILLVIDNSVSMIPNQTQLAEKIDKLVSQLGDRNFEIGVVSIFDFKIEQPATYWINGIGSQQIAKPVSEADYKQYINKEIIEYKNYALDKSKTKIFKIQKGASVEIRNEIAQSIKNYVNPNCSSASLCLKTKTDNTSGSDQKEQGLCVIKRQMEEAGVVTEPNSSYTISPGLLNEGDKLGVILISDENDSGEKCNDYKIKSVTPKLLPSSNYAQYSIFRKAIKGKYAAPAARKFAKAIDYKYTYTKWINPVVVDGVETVAGYWKTNVSATKDYKGEGSDLPFTSWVLNGICSASDAELVINRIKELNSGVKDFQFVQFSSYSCRYSSSSTADIDFNEIPSGMNYNGVVINVKDWVDGQACSARDKLEVETKYNWTLKECLYGRYQEPGFVSFYGAQNYVSQNPSSVTCQSKFTIDENGLPKTYNNIFEYNNALWSGENYISSSCSANYSVIPERTEYTWGASQEVENILGGDISASIKELARTKFNSSVYISSIVHKSGQSGCVPQVGQSYGTKYIDLEKTQYFGSKAKSSSICESDYSESILNLANSVLTPKNNVPLVLAANESIKQVKLIKPDGTEVLLMSSELSYSNGVLTINSGKLVVGSRIVITIQIN